jgi:hypothetical protein
MIIQKIRKISKSFSRSEQEVELVGVIYFIVVEFWQLLVFIKSFKTLEHAGQIARRMLG